MMWWSGDPGWGGWLVMGPIMVIFWGLVIFGGIEFNRRRELLRTGR